MATEITKPQHEEPPLVHPDECEAPNEQRTGEGFFALVKYLLLGMVFGFILYKAEVISWYRIQEMFRFQSFHMYGVIGSAVVTGALSLVIMRRLNIKTMAGETVNVKKKTFHWGNVLGGLTFGFGWALTGACPGPLYAQVGAGYSVVLVAIFTALLGTYTYGLLRDKLPH